MKPNLLAMQMITDHDNTPFLVRDNIPDVISALEEIGEKLLIWFSDKQMKLSTNKFHLLMNTCSDTRTF